MNAMIAAIKKRKGQGLVGGDHEASHESQHTVDKDVDNSKSSHLHDFVSNLSEGDKHKLKSILEKDKGDASQDINKGGPSTQERGKIAEAAQAEQSMNQMQDMDDHDDGGGAVDSDAIAASMVDHKAKSAVESGDVKPRNLSERVKMSLAAKLKSKGKL